MLRALMAQAQIDPDFGTRFREDFLFRRRDALATTRRPRPRARRTPRTALAPGTVIDVVFGTLWYRLLATREPVDGGLADKLVALLSDHASS